MKYWLISFCRFATRAITAAMLNVLSGTAVAVDSPEIKADKKMAVVEVSDDWNRSGTLTKRHVSLIYFCGR
ncbi:hypothetical protein [Shewanella fodinae]|uniref:hypothetical protein n=1 Tax=Shewanella fodinae TaxID=552357 RepID=UPI00105434F3|nr:hypothetical protein [Shewanella fodinae]